MKEFDLIIIGSGPGGYIAAQRAGQLGKEVLLIEKGELGGVCTNEGCIPTKSLLNSAKLYKNALESESKGLSVKEASYNLPQAMEAKNETINTLRSGIEFLMRSAKVTVVKGFATCVDSHTVQVDEQLYKAPYIILATGSSPILPPIEGIELDYVLTSSEILSLETLPETLTIIGGGVIGLEFASYFSTVGVNVTLIEMEKEIAPMMDHEIAPLLRRTMKKVNFHLGSTVTKIDQKQVYFTNAKKEESTIASEMVLVSVGRKANTAGLEQLSLTQDGAFIHVNEHLQTSIPHIYAIGDINGKSLLAHSASRMADVVISNLFGKVKQQMRYEAIPWAIYTLSEASGCGLTENQALALGRSVKTASIQMRSNGRFLAELGKREVGLCKVVVDEHTGALLGVHLIGPYSSEIIFGAATMIEAELRVEDIKEIVFPHPSVSEVIKDALFALDPHL
jgi:dihydrolipoamide dehydrogenase